MPELNWNKHDFVECLGVLYEISPYDNSYSFNVKNNSFSLKVNVIDYFSVIAIYASVANNEIPIFSIQFIVRDKVCFVSDKKISYLLFKDCVLITNDFYSVEDYKKKVFDNDKFPKYLNFELHTFPEVQLKFS